MSYCRFENTYQDLKDCIESLKLRELCKEYLELSEVEEEEENV